MANSICPLLKWDKAGYHQCKGKPISEVDLNSKTQFPLPCKSHYYTCDFAYFSGVGDMVPGTPEQQQRKATENCPRHYSWEEMKAKVGPALTLGLSMKPKSKS